MAGPNFSRLVAIQPEPIPATNVLGPGASTDNAIVRWDGATGTLLQDSAIAITDGPAPEIQLLGIGNVDFIARTLGTGAIILGDGSLGGVSGVAIGNAASTVAGADGVAISAATVLGANGIAIGNLSSVSANGVSVGPSANVLGGAINAISIGVSSIADGINATSLGPLTDSSGGSSLALAAGASAQAIEAIAAGRDSRALTARSISIGTLSTADGILPCISVGNLADSGGSNSTAIGDMSSSQALRSICVGTATLITSSGTNSLICGASSSIDQADCIVIGQGIIFTAANEAEENQARIGKTGVGLLNDLVVEILTIPDTLTNLETGKVITNTGAAGTPNLRPVTLPTASAGKQFSFYIDDTDGLRIVAGVGAKISVLGATSADGGRIESTTKGDAVHLVCISGANWVAMGGANLSNWTVT